MSYKGNASHMDIQSTIQIGNFDLENAEDVVSLAMLVRAPMDQKLYKDVENIQVEMMCIKPNMKIPSGEEPETTEKPESPDSAAVSTCAVDQSIFWPMIILTSATVMGLVVA